MISTASLAPNGINITHAQAHAHTCVCAHSYLEVEFPHHGSYFTPQFIIKFLVGNIYVHIYKDPAFNEFIRTIFVNSCSLFVQPSLKADT